MYDPKAELEGITSILQEVFDLIAQAQADPVSPEVGPLLDETRVALEQALAEVQQSVPVALQALAKARAENDQLRQEVEATIAEGRRKLAEESRRSPVPPPPEPAEAPIDPQLGLRLRDELLTRFGGTAPVAPTPELGSVFSRWDGFPAAPTSPPPAPAPAEPPAPDDSGLGSLWSRLDSSMPQHQKEREKKDTDDQSLIEGL